MHLAGPLPLTFEGPELEFRGKNCPNGSRGGGNLVTYIIIINRMLILMK